MLLKKQGVLYSYFFIGEFHYQLHTVNTANNPDDLLKIFIADRNRLSSTTKNQGV